MTRAPEMAGSFGKRLKELRAARGLTQQQLATAAGLSISFIAKMEMAGATHDPSWTTVQAIAKALGVDYTAFEDAGGTDPQMPAPKRKGKK